MSKTVTLKFYRQEIYDDVNQYAYVEADIIEDDTQARHQLFDITEDGNLDLSNRTLMLVTAKINEILFPFTKSDIIAGVSKADGLDSASQFFTITLNVPDTFSNTTAELLEQLIHKLYVYRIMEHWLDITKPDAAEKYRAKANALEQDVKSAKAIRTQRVRRKISCFP